MAPVPRPALAERALGRAARPFKERQVVQRPLRWLASRRRLYTPGDATIVVVSWQSRAFLDVCLGAVRRFSPPNTRIIVVDNHSSDGTVELLAGRPDVSSIRLPVNVGHGLAMDIGFLRVSTEFAVALDVDAFPISTSWLDTVIQPLQHGASVAGGASGRGLVHPSYLAMRTVDFVEGRHTFAARWRDELGLDAWDVGERISTRLAGRVHLVPATEIRGPGPLGTVFGDAVYHNFYAVRHLRAANPEVMLDGLVTAAEARQAWVEATQRFLRDA